MVALRTGQAFRNGRNSHELILGVPESTFGYSEAPGLLVLVFVRFLLMGSDIGYPARSGRLGRLATIAAAAALTFCAF